MDRAPLAWALLLALYWLGALAYCGRELDRIRLARYLPPRRRVRLQRLAVAGALIWPVLEFFELVARLKVVS